MEREFLTRALPLEITQKINKESNGIPQREKIWTTLTFAQSLDGKIAGTGGKQLILSGKESMLMTHWMRAMHDAILVGINTVINDNPQLNTRLLPDTSSYASPQPIVLDPSLRLPLDCKLLKNAAGNGGGKAPILFCGPPAIDHEMAERMFALMERGVTVIILPLDDAGHISLEDVGDSLFARGYRSLMIEGGQSVISSCLSPSSLGLINKVIVTIAPVIVGSSGMGVSNSGIGERRLKLVASGSLGDDLVAAYEVSNAS